MAANAKAIHGFDKEIHFTVFPDAFASSKTEHVWRWPRLIQNLSAPKKFRGSKSECELIKLATFGDVRTTKNSLRHDVNMRAVTGLVGDYDGEQISVEEAGRRLREHGVEAFLYTSASHTPEKPRWRVLAPLAVEADPAAHYSLMALLNAALGGILSTESFTASQTYYFGRVEGAAYESLHVAGALCADELSIEGIGPAKRERSPAKREPDDLDEAIVYDSVTEETISDLRSALAHLASRGWVDNGNRVKWIKLGHNLAGLGEAGEELFVEVSELGDAPDPENAVRDRFSTFRGDRSDYRAIFAAAQVEGWVNPRSGKQPELPPRKTTELAFVQASQFTASQHMEWLIKHVIPSRGLVVVYGDPGSGKSFYVLDMVCHVARGVAWNGKKTKQRTIAYIAAEGVQGFSNRLAAYAKGHSVDLSAIPLYVHGGSFILKQQMLEASDLVNKLEDVGIVVIDTLAAVTPGSNENTSEEMGAAIDAAQRIIENTGATVILIHHSNKGGDIRGWSGLKGAVDNQLRIERKDDSRTAHIEKMKDEKDGGAYGFRLRVVELGEDEDGDPVTSCVIEAVDETVPNTNGKKSSERKTTGGDFMMSEKYAKARHYLHVIEELVGLGDANIDESGVITAIQSDKTVNPLCEQDHPKASNIKRTLLTLAEKGKIRKEGRWIRLCE